MSDQYPIGSRQYQAQRNFLNNSVKDSTFSSSIDQQIFFDPSQPRQSTRSVQRHLAHYQPLLAENHSQQDQQSPTPYPVREAQSTHDPATLIFSQPYGNLFEQPYSESYEQQEFVATSSYAPTLDQRIQQHVDLPAGYGYEFEQQIYLQDTQPANGPLSEPYQDQECFAEEQPEFPGEFVADEIYAPVHSYYGRSMVLPANRQSILRQQQQGQNPQVVVPRQLNGMSLSAVDRRLSAPLQNSHLPMLNIHHMSHQRQNHHHNYRPQHIQQHNSIPANGDYYELRRARASLSVDRAHHQRRDPRLQKQPVQSVMVQNPNRAALQTYYGQTNDEHYDAAHTASAALSAKSPDFILQQNLQLRNRHDMIMNNGPSTVGVCGPSTIYGPSDESFDEGSTPLEVPAEMNIPFDSQPYGSQLTTISSSMLSEPTNVIGLPTTAAPALLAHDPPETNEKPVTPIESSDAMALARTQVDSHEMDVLPYERSDICRFSSVYDCNSVSGTPAQSTTTLQHQQQHDHSSQRSQRPGSRQQPFADANGSASNGSNQEQVTETLINEELVDPSPIADQRLLSSPKSNPREYLDMGTSGTVRQDWLDSICGHLIEHMNNFGICVIDNFLGSIKGELILQEVHRLYSNRRYSKGRLVSDKLNAGVDKHDSQSCDDIPPPTIESDNSGMKPHQQSERRLQGMAADATGTIRSDRVIWVDGCEDGCEEINNLIQTLCSVITNSSRLSLYTDNGLDKANINKRTKAHVACYPGSGTRYIKHVDNPNGDGRIITAIYYLNKNWNTKRDGGLLRMFPAGMDEVANIEPFFDRALFFWSDRRNPHEVLPSFRDRYAITVWYIGESRS